MRNGGTATPARSRPVDLVAVLPESSCSLRLATPGSLLFGGDIYRVFHYLFVGLYFILLFFVSGTAHDRQSENGYSYNIALKGNTRKIQCSYCCVGEL